MGAGIVLFFWLILAGIYGLFWLLFLAIFIAGKIKKSRILAWLGGVPLALSTSFALFCIGAFIYALIYISIPANVYKITFNMPPSADVTEMRSHYFYFADSGITYLKFKAVPATIKKLTAKNWQRLTPQKLEEEYSSSFQNGDAPSWWKPHKTPSTIVYKASTRHDFASEDEILMYDPVTQQAYYTFTGID